MRRINDILFIFYGVIDTSLRQILRRVNVCLFLLESLKRLYIQSSLITTPPLGFRSLLSTSVAQQSKLLLSL